MARPWEPVLYLIQHGQLMPLTDGARGAFLELAFGLLLIALGLHLDSN